LIIVLIFLPGGITGFAVRQFGRLRTLIGARGGPR